MSTTSTRLQPLDLRSMLQKSFAINPLLAFFGVSMVLTLIGTLIGIVVDHRVITGAPAWLKPTKFAISSCIYSFTLLWILGFIKGRKRLVSLIANVTAIAFIVEMVIIIGQVFRGTTSHFNFTTPLNETLFYIMGSFVVLLWLASVLAVVLLLFQRLPDPAFAWSLRLGILIAIIGMGLAFLMTRPTATQMAAVQAGGKPSHIGAHSVGVEDGGPGLPFLGWSTVGGDLRIPHFFGLHGLQAIPLLSWVLLLIARRLGVGRRGQVALVWTTGLAYLGWVLLLTWQALRGQSIVRPDALTLTAFGVLAGTTIVAISVILGRSRMEGSSEMNSVQAIEGKLA